MNGRLLCLKLGWIIVLTVSFAAIGYFWNHSLAGGVLGFLLSCTTAYDKRDFGVAKYVSSDTTVSRSE